MTVEEMSIEYWAHRHYDNPKLQDQEFEDEDFDLEAVVKSMEGDDWITVKDSGKP